MLAMATVGIWPRDDVGRALDIPDAPLTPEDEHTQIMLLSADDRLELEYNGNITRYGIPCPDNKPGCAVFHYRYRWVKNG